VTENPVLSGPKKEQILNHGASGKQSTRPCKRTNRRCGSCKVPAIAAVQVGISSFGLVAVRHAGPRYDKAVSRPDLGRHALRNPMGKRCVSARDQSPKLAQHSRWLTV
jgi:hypothetical protein